jgi:hypothetical protein
MGVVVVGHRSVLQNPSTLFTIRPHTFCCFRRWRPQTHTHVHAPSSIKNAAKQNDRAREHSVAHDLRCLYYS